MSILKCRLPLNLQFSAYFELLYSTEQVYHFHMVTRNVEHSEFSMLITSRNSKDSSPDFVLISICGYTNSCVMYNKAMTHLAAAVGLSLVKQLSHTLTSFSIPNFGIRELLDEHLLQNICPQARQWCYNYTRIHI